MRAHRYRVILPIVFGAIAAALMAWDLHNEQFIRRMGMAWDTGEPIWPYRTPQIIIVGLFFPAFILAAPLLLILDLPTFPERYPILLPCAALWWYLVGSRLDFGLVPRSWLVARRRAAVIPLLVGQASVYLGIAMAVDEADRRSGVTGSLWSVDSIPLISSYGPSVWCLLLAVWLGIVAIEIAGQGRKQSFL